MNPPAAGDPAPDVALPDDHGVVHRLADQRGRWTVLYFYPRDDTPGCTTEACEFRDANAELLAEGVDIWGISTDTVASHASFRDKFSLSFPLLADPDRLAHDAYGTWVEKKNYGRTFMGTQRATFLVDPDGRVARVWPKVRPEGHAADVLAAVRSARAARAVGETAG